MIEFILSPFKIFTNFPLAALIPAILFFFLWRKRRSKLILSAVILWVVYTAYESYMTYIWSPTVSGPIRVDILLVAPVLYLMSIVAVIKFFRKTV